MSSSLARRLAAAAGPRLLHRQLPAPASACAWAYTFSPSFWLAAHQRCGLGFDGGFVLALQRFFSCFDRGFDWLLSRPLRACRHARPAIFSRCAPRLRPGCGLALSSSFSCLRPRSASASFTICWISSSVRPELALMVILFSLPVPLSLATRARCRWRRCRRSLRSAARRAVRVECRSKLNLPSDLLPEPSSRSPCSTWMVTARWLSSAVEKVCEAWSGWWCSS